MSWRNNALPQLTKMQRDGTYGVSIGAESY